MILPCLGLLKLTILLPLYFVKIRFFGEHKEVESVKDIGILHVPCHANGGGEKVLWAIVNRLVQEKKYNIHIYSDIMPEKEAMIEKVNKFFGYNLKLTDFNLIELNNAHLSYSENWKIFSRYLEGWAQVLVTVDALNAFMPDLFIETATSHFSVFATKLLNPHLRTISYVHYPYTTPTVVEDYFKNGFFGPGPIKAKIFSILKGVYHYGLLVWYKVLAYFSDVCLTNSSWTQAHMVSNWGEGVCEVVYPPCSVTEFWEVDRTHKKNIIVSLGQFRPEKRHDIQLDMLKYHQKLHPESDIELRILGSAKFAESEEIIKHLEHRIKTEKIKNVKILRDLRFNDLKQEIKQATYGIHTMIDEHFGIGIVDMLSGGLITLAHKSAGPRDDILGNHTHELYGYLAEDDKDFNVTLNKLIENYQDPQKREVMLQRTKKGQDFAKKHLSNEAFADKMYKFIVKADREIKAAAHDRMLAKDAKREHNFHHDVDQGKESQETDDEEGTDL